MENKWRGCSAQGRDLGKRKMVLWFRRLLCAFQVPWDLCALSEGLGCCMWHLGSAGGGGHPLCSEYRGILSEIQRTLRSAPSFPVPRTRKD